jgi:hypothetical protein
VATIRLSGALLLPAAVATMSVAGFGKKGSGKTNTGQLLFERLHEIGAQCVALDPVGNWWSLRLSASGKRRGLDIPVFGGDHGDIPVGPNGGKLMAQVVVERRISCVIDLMNFKPEQRRLFAADFAEELFHLKKRKRTVLHLFLEEARKFAPQQPSSKLDYRLLGAFDDIVRLGRNYGLGVTLLDQRPQSVNKEVTSQTEILIVHQLIEKEGRKSIEDWVRSKKTEGGEQLEKLDLLKVGEAIVWAPGTIEGVHRVKVDKKTTYDASKTPEIGDAGGSVEPMPLTGEDFQRLEEAMKEVVEQAAATDPTKLQMQVRQLKVQIDHLMGQNKALQQIAATPAPAQGRTKTVKVEVPVISKADWKRLEQILERFGVDVAALDKQRDRLAQAQQATVSELGNLKTLITRSQEAPPLRAYSPPPAARDDRRDKALQKFSAALAETAAREKDKQVIGEISAAAVTKAELKLLEALAWNETLGIMATETTTLAILAGYTVNGHFNNMRGHLRALGLVEYGSGGTTMLTAIGREMAPRPEAPLTTRAVQDMVKSRLKPKEWQVLDPLLRAYPATMPVDELASAAGYTVNGHFNNMRGRLRSLGLVDYVGPGATRAADRLFIGGDRE